MFVLVFKNDLIPILVLYNNPVWKDGQGQQLQRSKGEAEAPGLITLCKVIR